MGFSICFFLTKIKVMSRDYLIATGATIMKLHSIKKYSVPFVVGGFTIFLKLTVG